MPLTMKIFICLFLVNCISKSLLNYDLFFAAVLGFTRASFLAVFAILISLAKEFVRFSLLWLLIFLLSIIVLHTSFSGYRVIVTAITVFILFFYMLILTPIDLFFARISSVLSSTQRYAI